MGRIIFKAKPLSMGQIIFKAKPPSMGRIIFKAKPPSMGRKKLYEESHFYCLAPKARWLSVVCCQRLVTQGEREGESLSALRVESAQLHGVPWVIDVHPYLGVA
jgi:hypothetical protein